MDHLAEHHPGTVSPFSRRIPWLVSAFRGYSRRYLARNLGSLRLHQDSLRVGLPPGPVVVALNHPSWWDPLVALILAPRLGRSLVVAPMEAKALRNLPLFDRMGIFGLSPGSGGAMARLVEVARELAERPDGALWITPQGRFTDVRDPVFLRGGVGHAVHELRGGSVVTLALEYVFWNERKPEALARFGTPFPVADGRERSPREWTALVERQLSENMAALALAARARDPSAFEDIVETRSGIHKVYDLFRSTTGLFRPRSRPSRRSITTAGQRP